MAFLNCRHSFKQFRYMVESLFACLFGKGGIHVGPLIVFTGCCVGSAARFLVHYLTGVFVWGEYMPETFFGMTMTTPWFYSALYNGSYMLLDLVFCLLLGWLLWKPLGKYIRGEDIRPQDATK